MEVREIRTELTRLGRTQAELAAYLGLSKGQMSELLSGKRRMPLDTFRKIETFLAEAARPPVGVAETPPASFLQKGPRFMTLEEVRSGKYPPVRLSKEEYERIWRALSEIGEALKRAPRVTDLSDDEILGYDETP